MTTVTQLTPSSERDPDGGGDRADRCEQRRRLTGLIEACGAGDRAAFRRLYDLSSRFVFGVVLAILRDSGMAEDVAQEVYVSVWKRAGTFDTDKGNPLAWMAAIARNRAIDRLRAERSRGFVSYSDQVPDIASDAPPADLTIDAIAVRRALTDLRPEFRSALLLTYFKGYTHSELAGVMNVPVGTAKSWVRRGLSSPQGGARMTADRNINDLSMLEHCLGVLDAPVWSEVPGTRPDRADQTHAKDALLGGLATLAPPVDPPEGLFAAIEAEIDASTLPQIDTLRADEDEWIELSDKIWKKTLFSDSRTGKSMYLLRCAAGAILPSHKHDHDEHVFVIEGEFWVGDLLVKTGDFQMAQAGSIHPEHRSPTGCLVLMHH